MIINRKLISSILLVLLGVLTAHAQEQPPQPIVDFAAFPGETFAQEKARLDHFARLLQAAPSSTRGFIIAYGDLKGSAGEARRRARQSKVYLVRRHKVAASRVVAIDGGRREMVEVEHFIVPVGVKGPTPYPYVGPSEARPARRQRVKRAG